MLYSKVLHHVAPSCGFSTLATFREHDRIIQKEDTYPFQVVRAYRVNLRKNAVCKDRKPLGLSWYKEKPVLLMVNMLSSSITNTVKKNSVHSSGLDRATEGLEV